MLPFGTPEEQVGALGRLLSDMSAEAKRLWLENLVSPDMSEVVGNALTSSALDAVNKLYLQRRETEDQDAIRRFVRKHFAPVMHGDSLTDEEIDNIRKELSYE